MVPNKYDYYVKSVTLKWNILEETLFKLPPMSYTKNYNIILARLFRAGT